MIVESGTNVIQVRDDLRRIPAPYLLRKYDATVEDFDLIVDEDLRCEFLDGVLIVHSPASYQHEERIMFLGTLLMNHVSPQRLGRVSGSNTVLQFGDRRLCPDLSFLKTEHEDRIQKGVVVGPTDLVIEFLSKSTRDYDLREKRAAYRAGGVPEIWLLDLLRHEAHVDFAEGNDYVSESFSSGRIHSRVLPDFSIDVAWLWSDPLPNPLECLTGDK